MPETNITGLRCSSIPAFLISTNLFLLVLQTLKRNLSVVFTKKHDTNSHVYICESAPQNLPNIHLISITEEL